MRKAINTRTIESERKRCLSAGKATYVWDTDLKGFGAYISAKGEVSWLAQRWVGGVGGRPIRHVIERSPPMSLDAARKQAEIELGDIRKGVNIVARKKAQRDGQRDLLQAMKLKDAVDLYIKRNSKPGRYWSDLEQMFANFLVPQLGDRTSVAEITKQDIRKLIDARLDAGQQASARVFFAALNPFFKWCVGRDMIASSPMQDMSPPSKVASRDRVLTDDEIKSFWSFSYKLGWPFCPFYRLLLLTAQRRDEVAGMRRSEIDLAKGEWIIPKERTKNGKEHLVHLSPQAIAVLEELPTKTDLVFTTTGTTPLSGFSRAKSSLDVLMPPVKPWRIHDLRRTAATGMAGLGFSPHIVERVLNHMSGAQGGIVGVYQRFEFVSERRQAINSWSEYISRLIVAQ